MLRDLTRLVKDIVIRLKDLVKNVVHRKLNRNMQFGILAIVCVVALLKLDSPRCAKESREDMMADAEQILDFDGFNNKNFTPWQPNIVPNIVHLVYMNQTELRFHEMICIYSIFLNQNPDVIMIHCENCSFTGVYWDKIMSIPELKSMIYLNPIPVRRSIFNKKSGSPVYAMSHRGDYWRILLLMEYGGIYLDNDVYVIQSMDWFRRFEATVGFQNINDYTMGSQVILAHKNARFLRAWFDSYRVAYAENEWYTNAGHIPGRILNKTQELAHFVPFKFGNNSKFDNTTDNRQHINVSHVIF